MQQGRPVLLTVTEFTLWDEVTDCYGAPDLTGKTLRGQLTMGGEYNTISFTYPYSILIDVIEDVRCYFDDPFEVLCRRVVTTLDWEPRILLELREYPCDGPYGPAAKYELWWVGQKEPHPNPFLNGHCNKLDAIFKPQQYVVDYWDVCVPKEIPFPDSFPWRFVGEWNNFNPVEPDRLIYVDAGIIIPQGGPSIWCPDCPWTYQKFGCCWPVVSIHALIRVSA
jgi:hypothetical protein